ncbi:hypothetical protein [Aquimarina latercula]|uniref:hypothetical protein n=1 Tax=Aquimarina latercula TaxID=987 RepID=UPI0003FCCABC|nr:hypothetical protein [Aquimarina latercula]
MKDIRLLILLILIFLSLKSIAQENYIQLINGEKINIVEYQDIKISKSSVIYSTYRKNKHDPNWLEKNVLKTHNREKISKVSHKEVSKIVLGDRLFMPFPTKKNGKGLKICEIVAVNNNFTLVRFENYSLGPGSNSYTPTRVGKFFIYDKKNNILDSGSLSIKKKKKVFESIKRYFNNCTKLISILKVYVESKNDQYLVLLENFHNLQCPD